MRHITLAALALALGLSASACGGNPAAPTAASEPSRPTSTLSGVVFTQTAAGLVPVEGAKVQVAGYASATSDSSGAYRVPGLYPGSQVVATSKDGYEPDSRSVSIAGETEADIRIARREAHTLSGTVFEATPSGPRPIAGLEMYCDTCGEFGHTRLYTDANGSYSFTHVYNGQNTVLLSRGGYLNVQKSVTVRGDTRVDITVDPLP